MNINTLETIYHAIAIFDKLSIFFHVVDVFFRLRETKREMCTIPIYCSLQAKFVWNDLNNPYKDKTNKQTNQRTNLANSKQNRTRQTDCVRRACKERGSKCFIVCHSPITYVAIYLDKITCVSCSLAKHATISCRLLLCAWIRLQFKSECRIEIASERKLYLIKINLWVVTATL